MSDKDRHDKALKAFENFLLKNETLARIDEDEYIMYDLECDPVEIEIDCMGVLRLNTEDYTHITVDETMVENLKMLIERSKLAVED